MKKAIVLMLCAAILLTAVACGTNVPPKTGTVQTGIQQQAPQQAEHSATTGSEGDVTQLPDPFTTYDSLETCAAGAGLDLTVPETIGGSASRIFRAIPGEMAEVIYLDASGEELCRIRKAAGNDDISGDYNEYAQSSLITVGETIVSYRGGDGLVQVANWSIGEYTFSLTLEKGMDTEAVAGIVKSTR